MNRRVLLLSALLLLASFACVGDPTLPPEPAIASPQATIRAEGTSVFDTEETAYGFFPSPPEFSLQALLTHFEDLGDFGDFILMQPNVPWEDFVDGVEGQSQARQDLHNQILLAQQNGLDWAFVVDPLNGLNRREFHGVPTGWQPTFSNPDIRNAYTNFAMWIVREFDPRYLGLASEINTYMDAHPDDADSFLTLYRETYRTIKAESSDTQVFVTFQWDDLHNAIPSASEGRPPTQINWEQVELFEPELDLWAISSYPYFIYNGGARIPNDYYTPLVDRTDKPLAVAEGGFTSRQVGPVLAAPEDQVAYLEAIHDQLGDRLAFWVYIILNDLNMESIGGEMRKQGRPADDIETLSLFASVGLREADGSPKPALALWEGYRQR